MLAALLASFNPLNQVYVFNARKGDWKRVAGDGRVLIP